MDHPITVEHRDEVGAQLTRRVAQAIKDGLVHWEDVPILVDFIVSKIKSIMTHNEMVNFLLELNNKWPAFDTVLIKEKSFYLSAKDAQEINKIQTFFAQAKAR